MKPESIYGTRLKAPVLSAIVCLTASSAAFGQSPARDGFWKDKENPESHSASRRFHDYAHEPDMRRV